MNIGAVGYSTDFYRAGYRKNSSNDSASKFTTMGSATQETTSSNNGKTIGVTTAGNTGLLAKYADSSTPAEPIIKVGDYEVRVNDVDPNNATELEMFALMSYMEDVGMIEKHGIASYSKMKAYDAYDIGIIVNNLLQNALEACEKMNTGERYITLSGKQKRKFFLIEVRNSFDGEIKFDSNTNLPVSDKEKDISLHGIGLSNVKREVEKYMGDLDIKVKKNEFSVTILLQERRTENEY